MPTFRNREKAIEQICADQDSAVLLNIYGEAGIGKSRLLQEAAQQLEATSPPTMVIHVDLEALTGTSTDRAEATIRALIAQSKGRLSGVWQSLDQMTGHIVAQLTEIARQTPVVLMFDTTEVLQEDMAFWRWMEANLVGPLVIEATVRQIFAGRVPAPWRRIEVRRAVQLVHLEPLSPQGPARELVLDVLRQHAPRRTKEQSLSQAVDLIIEISHGHPLLSERLAEYVAPQWPVVASVDDFRRQVCREVVRPFVDGVLFQDVMPPWKEILWWVSALDWFDVTILRRYLEQVDPALVKGQPDYFFIQGIDRLRIRNTVVWREARGDRLHGIIANIMRRCLEISNPERYHKACQAAATTFDALADEFPEGFQEAQQYRQEATRYRHRARGRQNHE